MDLSTSHSDDALSPADPMEAIRYGGFWIRVGASVLDFIVLLPLTGAAFFVQNATFGAVLGVAMLFYKPFFEKTYGATPGKMLLGLRVVNRRAEKIDWLAAWLRASFGILSSIPSLLMSVQMRQAGIEPLDVERVQAFNEEHATLQMASTLTSLLWLAAVLTVAFHPRKQGLHDMLASTFVVYKESLPDSK